MSEQFKDFIQEGDLENYKAKMQIKQFVNPHVNYMPDRLSVEIVSDSRVWDGIAAIQSTYPFDGNLLVSYFEMTAKTIPANGLSCIGLSGRSFPANKIPGMDEIGGYSIGYVSRGDVIATTGEHNKFVRFKEGDIVGCGLNSYSNEIFFTINGSLIGDTWVNAAEEDLFPTVGLQGIKSSVTMNFGRKSFAFDLAGLIRKTKENIIQDILQEEVRSDDIHVLIKNHLEVHGFPETLQQFEHKDEDTYKSFLVHRRDFKSTDTLRE